MAKYNVHIPATMDQSEYEFVCTDNFISVAKDALQDYNANRDHDGQPPLNRMPNGTIYSPIYEYVIQGNYGCEHGFEDLTAEDTCTDAMFRLHEYRDNEPGVVFKMVARRV